MELTEHPKGKRLVGSDSIELTEGQWLQIRTGIPGATVEQLEEQCPAGKKWSVLLTIRIDESDV